VASTGCFQLFHIIFNFHLISSTGNFLIRKVMRVLGEPATKVEMQLSRVSVAILLAAIPALADTKVDFAKQIQPIFEKSCIKCHGPEKQKGGLRLDQKEAALKGGKDAVAIVPGDAAKSDLYRRITLPDGSDDVMPNQGSLLSKAETDLIRDWINQGATWPESAIAKTEKPVSSEPTKLPDVKSSPAELKAIANLDTLGISVRPIAQGVNWHEANLRGYTNAADNALVQLKDVTTLMELNLSGTKFSDASAANLKLLVNLTHLHLEHTPIKDAGLANVEGMTHLAYLNLFDTSITDAGLEHLTGLTNLQNLHLWQTKVTDAGVAKLQKTLPKCNIVQGASLPVIAKNEAKPADAKADKPAEKKKKKKKS
jgi:mono/diheme cytochrome c family protein